MKYILFYTRTDVFGGEELLKDAAVPYTVSPTPDRMGVFCGLCLKIEDKDAQAAEQALNIKLHKLI